MMRARKAASVAAALTVVAAVGLHAPARAQDAATPASTGSVPQLQPSGPLSEGVAAIVNDNIISTYDLQQRMRLLVVTSGVRPTSDTMPQIEQEALRSLIDERLELQEIRREEKEQKFKIMADDNDVARDLARLAEGSRMTGAQLINALASAGVGADTLKEELRAQISWERWIQGRYGGSRLKISQEQINAALRQLQADAAKPQFQISEIFLDAARVGGPDAAMAGANQLVAQLQQGAPFAAVARQFSGASTAANGGDAGWILESELQPEVRAVVDEMRSGQLSKPISVQGGVYIIYLRDKRAGAGSDIVSLKQAAISLPASAPTDQVVAAQQKLLALKAQIKGCADLEAKAAKVEGVIAGDLGEADVRDLRPAFRDAAESLQQGQISDPIRTDIGLHLVALCGKRQSGVTLPSREEIEARLEDQKLSLVARRYLRDLRASATIDLR
jgi:peptidyl-prolyl cis-trans isomerase SurA